MQGETPEEKLECAQKITIRSCRRLGRFNRNRVRLLSVELTHKQDLEYILENRMDLEKGVYVDREYPFEIERKRKTLLPVLRAAKRLDEYKKQSRMEDDKIVLKGKAYTVYALNQLPEELNVFKVTSREDQDTVGSNFHPPSFHLEGIDYISSEQYIQASEAKYFDDYEKCNKIL